MCSGTVYRALYLDEIVAAKEIDIGRGLAMQEAFVNVSGIGACQAVLPEWRGQRMLLQVPAIPCCAVLSCWDWPYRVLHPKTAHLPLPSLRTCLAPPASPS